MLQPSLCCRLWRTHCLSLLCKLWDLILLTKYDCNTLLCSCINFIGIIMCTTYMHLKACKNFDNNGTCVTQCPPEVIYDRNLFRVVPNPDYRLSLGNLCVEECSCKCDTVWSRINSFSDLSLVLINSLATVSYMVLPVQCPSMYKFVSVNRLYPRMTQICNLYFSRLCNILLQLVSWVIEAAAWESVSLGTQLQRTGYHVRSAMGHVQEVRS